MASLELGSVAIRAYALEVMNSEIQDRLIPLLSSSDGVLDFQDIFRRFSFDNICRFSFGFDPKCLEPSLPVSEFTEAFDVATKLSAERAVTIMPLVWKVKRFFKIGSEKKLSQAINTINDLADEVIKNKRRTELSIQNDLLSRFMGSVNDDKYLRDIVISFLLAGRDTVAAALTSFFWLLTQHPEVMSAVRAESDLVMGQTQQGPASFEQMRKMHYLHAAVHESMRLFPPIQFDSKFCQEDDTLPDGTFVKKGTRVTYHPYAMGRMDRIWGPDCLEFKPNRWLKDGVFSPISPFKYPVFQGGLRVCLGKELAIVEVKSVVISLIRQFDIVQAGPIQSPKFVPSLTATVKGGLPILVRRRGV